MADDLIQWVAQQLDADIPLSDEVGVLVLAALEGDASLDECLEGGASSLDVMTNVARDREEPEPRGAFLKSIEVEGFRGIGERTTLELSPQPGLTIIAGRNGSGKSSLAEALEVVLTGTTYRWKNKAAQWKEQWRNLHHANGVEILVRIAEEGAGVTTICTSWPDGVSDVAAASSWVQRPGEKRDPGMASLGWFSALDVFRPLMSYDELGGMLEAGPSALYDALSKALGVEQITDGIRRLEHRTKTLKAPADALVGRRKSLQTESASLDDERARQAATLLRKTQPNSGALRELATGAQAADTGTLGTLRSLAMLTGPDGDSMAEVSDNLRAAVAGMVTAGEAELARRVARLTIRKHALQAHEKFGDMTCPVCAGSHLDAAWAESTRLDVERQSRDLGDLEAARATLDLARGKARSHIQPPPNVLNIEHLPGIAATVAQARHAWDIWSAAPTGDLDLAQHLDLHAGTLISALDDVRGQASEELQARQDAWGPVAIKIAAFCSEWDDWLTTKPVVDNLVGAAHWLKRNDTRLKNERLEPIAEAARHAWAMLRQESNVDLGSLTLEGSSTRRRVAIEAAVDGKSAGALAVMSQGELHALALALFLPRASMPESPFRFLILDDPVQAMDPAKIDGLIRLLAELAETRQVIVLSHDDRLPLAARRSQDGVRILEVSRGTGSRVSFVNSVNPADRYLSDAHALVRDVDLPADSMRRTLPGLLRFALEAAARDVVFEHRLSKGLPLGDVEAAWSLHHSTRDRVSLALYDEVRSLDPWLVRGYRRLGLGVACSAMHTGLKHGTDPLDACRAVADVMKDVRAGIKQ